MTNFDVYTDSEEVLASFLAGLILSEKFRDKIRYGVLFRKENDATVDGERFMLLTVQIAKWLKQEPDPHGLVYVVDKGGAKNEQTI